MQPVKLRLVNNSDASLRVFLEPWATEYLIAPGDFLDFQSDGSVSEGSFFRCEYRAGNKVEVCPEWDGGLVSVYDSGGHKIF